MGVRITRLRITDYRGVAAFDREIPPQGVVIEGKNAGGKTSIIRALSAALAAQGCDPQDIRIGADAAEILVDLDAIQVRRAISKKSTSVTVTQGDARWNRPQTKLNEMFGTGGVDPLSLLLEKPERRRQLLLEALPITVTAADIERWLGPGKAKDEDLSGHGLVVVSRLRKRYYESRTEANRILKAETSAREKAEAEAAGFVVDPDAATQPGAKVGLELAMNELRELEIQTKAASAAEATVAAARARIAEKRARAAEMRDQIQAQLPEAIRHVEDLGELLKEATAEVSRLEQRLAAAKAAEASSLAAYGNAKDARRRIDEMSIDATRISEEADADERALVVPVAPPLEDVLVASERVTKSREILERAVRNTQAVDLHQRVEAAKAAEATQRALADDLDRAVVALTTVAAAELATRTGIPGLVVDGDDIRMDGVALDSLSGAEQMRFTVEIAKRANGGKAAKLLVVDGLERLDGARGLEFVKIALEGGWQLIATRVADGDVQVHGFEIEEDGDDANER